MNSVSVNKTTTEEILNAKRGRTFISPKGEKYQFDYEKIGRRYIYILIYNGLKMQIKPKDYNDTPIDSINQRFKPN